MQGSHSGAMSWVCPQSQLLPCELLCCPPPPLPFQPFISVKILKGDSHKGYNSFLGQEFGHFEVKNSVWLVHRSKDNGSHLRLQVLREGLGV